MVNADAHPELRDLITDPATVLADPGQLERLRAAGDTPAGAYADARATQVRARAEFDRVFEVLDVLAGVSSPTSHNVWPSRGGSAARYPSPTGSSPPPTSPACPASPSLAGST